MKERERLSSRLLDSWERLCWGLADCRLRLVERGAWPAPQQALVQPDGLGFSLLGRRLRPRSDSQSATGLLVPEPDCLWGRLQLPAMPRAALAAAVQEALWRVSPLPLDQILVAWRAEPDPAGDWMVNWGLCRRGVAQQGLAHQGLPDQAPVFLVHQGQAYIADGPAQHVLGRRQRQLDGFAAFGVLLVALSVLVLALTPLLLKRQAVVRAMQHVKALEQQAAPLRQQLDELRSRAEVAQGLKAGAQVSVPLARVIEELSAHLPDDTWLDRIDVNGGEIRIAGVTGDAGSLLSTLARQPVFADVRASGASVRDNALNKERFTFDMRWRNEGNKP